MLCSDEDIAKKLRRRVNAKRVYGVIKAALVNDPLLLRLKASLKRVRARSITYITAPIIVGPIRKGAAGPADRYRADRLREGGATYLDEFLSNLWPLSRRLVQ
jgi:hypothetical protein